MKSLLREGREWEVVPPSDGSLVQEIESSLGCSPAFAQVLARRGGREWPRLIDPGVDRFYSPFLLTGMEDAVQRLLRAVERGERLFLHGDFDVDGLSGAAVLYLGLTPLFKKGTIKVDVGDRARGHGLSREFVTRAIDEGFSLVVTADCGVSNLEEVALLREAGIDTLLTDHHVPPPDLPAAIAVVDPMRPGETYPNPYLSGVGVAYKLICGLYERLRRPLPHALLDLVALGTIADLVPLADGGEVENRAMVREALSLIARGEGSSLGLCVLLEKLKLNKKRLTASDIGFYVAPKLNAANRTGDPKVAFLLLTTGLPERAEYLTEVLLDYNRDREVAQDDLIAQAEERMADEGADPRRDGIVILCGKYWNEGILGLAASHLAERYHVPAVIISQGDRTSRASCRSVGGFDMAACLKAHAPLLLQYGGHRMAAGFSVANDLLPELRVRLLAYVRERSCARAASVATIDARVAPDEVDLRFYTNICSLAPYGPGNPAPRFLLPDCAFAGLSLVGGRRQHLRGKVVQNGTALPFIAFRMGGHIAVFEEARGACVVFRAGFDDWQGTVQLEVVDLVAG